MFNFTTTTLIHSVDLFAANPTTVAQGQFAADATRHPSNNVLWVNGVNLFRKENVVAIYRNPYIAPLAGRLVVDIDEIGKAIGSSGLFNSLPSSVRIRLKFSLRRTGDNNSYYARDEVFKGKDFVYEFIYADSTTTAATVAKQIKKINRLYGDIYLDVHVGKQADDDVLNAYDGAGNTGTTTMSQGLNNIVNEVDEIDKLVFVNDNYGLFTDASLEVWVDGHSDCCTYQDGGWIPFDQIDCNDVICVQNCSTGPCDNITRGVKNSTSGLLHIVDCVNGTGTYQQILRDLRLPTMENLGYMSLTQQMNEMPIPGMNYVQYTLHYVKCRGTLGGSAVGEVTHSKTTHVFFVPATCCNCADAGIVNIDEAFQAALNTAFGWEYCTGEVGEEAPNGRLVAAPHDDPTLAPSFKGQLAPAKLNETRTNNDTLPEAILEEIEESGNENNQSAPAGGDIPGFPEPKVEGPEEESGGIEAPIEP